ncbi:MAG: hypothetical protein ACP5OE_09900 [Thermodesulfobium sp.]
MKNTKEINAYLIGGVAINSYIQGTRYTRIRPSSTSNDIDFASTYIKIKDLPAIAYRLDGKISPLIQKSTINYSMNGLSGNVTYDPAPVLTLNEKLNGKEIQIFPEFVGPIKVDRYYKGNDLLRVSSLETLVATQLNPMSFEIDRLRKVDIAVAAESEKADEPMEFVHRIYDSGANRVCKAVDDVEKIAKQTSYIVDQMDIEDYSPINWHINYKSYSYDNYIDLMKKTAKELKNAKIKEKKVIRKYSKKEVADAVENGLEIFNEKINNL